LTIYLVSTIAACTSRIIHNITSTIINSEEFIHVFPACPSYWCIEVIQLRCSADNRPAVQLCDNHAANEAREGIELEEPGAPERGDLRVRDGDTAEKGKRDDQERIEEGADDWSRC
jgi:hypothetical protein